jgi:hypothetical protein
LFLIRSATAFDEKYDKYIVPRQQEMSLSPDLYSGIYIRTCRNPNSTKRDSKVLARTPKLFPNHPSPELHSSQLIDKAQDLTSLRPLSIQWHLQQYVYDNALLLARLSEVAA